MDKQLQILNHKISLFRKRMKYANLNLHQISNNFPQTKSVYLKQSEIIDGDSIHELIMDYVSFFNENKPILEQKLSKNYKLITNIAPILAELYSIYNELVNYADLMLIEKYYDSYQKQYQFITSEAFLNILNHLPKQKATQLMINAKLCILITILCLIKQNSQEELIVIFNKIYQELDSDLKNQRFNVSQYKRFILIDAFWAYIQQKPRISHLYLGLIYYEFKKAYPKLPSYQVKAKMALDYIGLGKYPYLTMPLPQEFKTFVHYTLNNISLKYQDILNEVQKIKNNH